MPPTVPILMYHAISDHTTREFSSFAVTPSEFAEQLDLLAHRGCRTLTVTELVSRWRSGKAVEAGTVVLTFDDAYHDFLSTALPLLLRHGMTATLYAVAGSVGGRSDWLSSIGEGRRRLLGWRELAEVASAGSEIGAHGLTHRALDGLPGPALEAEVTGSKRRIEDRLGIEVASFCYPYGFHDARAKRAVSAAGFTSACAVRYAGCCPADDALRLPRHIVRRGTTLPAFDRILDDRHPRFDLAIDRARSRCFSVLRPWLRKGGLLRSG